jgi:hypothetical protein
MPVSCECCLLSGRGLCYGPIPCPEESRGFLLVIAWCAASIHIWLSRTLNISSLL